MDKLTVRIIYERLDLDDESVVADDVEGRNYYSGGACGFEEYDWDETSEFR